MKKVKGFFVLLKKSLIPHYPFYHTIPRLTFIDSFYYFVSLILLLNLLFLTFMVVRVQPMKIYAHLKNVSTQLTAFPSDLTIILKNGMLFTTYDKPYYFWLDDNGNKKLLFVIDKNVSDKTLVSYNAPFVLNSKTFFFKKDPAMKVYKSLPLTVVGNQTISRATILESAKTMQTITRYFIPLLLLTLILIYIMMVLLSFAITVLYLLVASGIVYLLFYVLHRKHPYPFQTILHIGFYALTLPLILDYLMSFFHFTGQFTPFLFIVLYSIFVWGGVHEAYYKKNNR